MFLRATVIRLIAIDANLTVLGVSCSGYTLIAACQNIMFLS